MLKIGVAGVSGRMGNTIAALAEKTAGIKLALLTERPGHELIGKELFGIKVTDNLSKGVAGIDVYIDFTVPAATLSALKIMTEAKKAYVIGTTGFKPNELTQIKTAAKIIPMVLSSNYSIGVNVMWKLVKEATKIMKQDYDIDIVEAHHRMKKDAPSGTAMTTAKIIIDEKGLNFEKNVIFGRDGRDNERPRDQVGILAVRAGGIVGEHTVIYGSMEDKLEISHTAFSRETFAAGALKAAKFVKGKTAKVYSMAEVLGL
ncbi:MAG: 4-hydroxy-tetrahydrodipicolinate reductase [bacterium]